MLRLVLTAACLWAIHGLAWAQDATDFDPARLAAAHALLTEKNEPQAVRQIMAGLTSAPLGGDPAAASLPEMTARLDKAMPEIIDAEAELYAQTFTLTELDDALAFYQSPSGRAVVRKLPTMIAQAPNVVRSVMPRVLADAERDYCRRQSCTTMRGEFERVMAGLGPAPIEQPAPNPTSVALARRMISLEHIDSGIANGAAQKLTTIALYRSGDPESRHILQAMAAGFQAELPRLMDVYAAALARLFTLQELQDYMTFKNSPSGRSMQAKSMLVTDKITPLVKDVMLNPSPIG